MDGPERASRSPGAPATAPAQSHEVLPRKKQKRNKPTLSCEECVERKTKVRQGVRPDGTEADFAPVRPSPTNLSGLQEALVNVQVF